MISVLSRLKKRRREKRERDINDRKKWMAHRKAVIEAAAIAMTKRPCAINEMRPCERECVHFREGFVESMPDPMGGEFSYAERPSCRLWRRG